MYIWIAVGILGGIILLSILLSIASFSSERFMQIYEKCDQIKVKSGLTIQDFIYNLNYNYFNNSITIKQIEKKAGDFYNSKSKTIGLSKNTLSSNSVASFAIVAHEMGHAKQDKEGKTLKRLNSLRYLGFFISLLFLPLLLASAILLFWMDKFLLVSIILASCAGLILILAIITKALTISLEKQASKYGLEFLKDFLNEEELKSAKNLLKSAKLSYWGDLLRLLFSWTLLTRKTKLFS